MPCACGERHRRPGSPSSLDGQHLGFRADPLRPRSVLVTPAGDPLGGEVLDQHGAELRQDAGIDDVHGVAPGAWSFLGLERLEVVARGVLHGVGAGMNYPALDEALSLSPLASLLLRLPVSKTFTLSAAV